MCNEPPFYYLYPESRFHSSPIWPMLQVFDKKAVKSIDRIAVLDDLNKTRVKKVYGRSSEIVRTGVDLTEPDSFDFDGFRSSHSLGTGKIILQVGTAERKRPEDTIRAVSTLENRFNCVLVLVGYDRRGQLTRLARDLGVLDRVRFFDAVT